MTLYPDYSMAPSPRPRRYPNPVPHIEEKNNRANEHLGNWLSRKRRHIRTTSPIGTLARCPNGPGSGWVAVQPTPGVGMQLAWGWYFGAFWHDHADFPSPTAASKVCPRQKPKHHCHGQDPKTKNPADSHPISGMDMRARIRPKDHPHDPIGDQGDPQDRQSHGLGTAYGTFTLGPPPAPSSSAIRSTTSNHSA